MLTMWIRVSTIALTMLGTLLASAAAWADAEATLRSGQAPTTAVAFPTHACEENLGRGPYPGNDVWSFVLPDRARQFVTLTVVFDTDGDSLEDTTLSTPAAGEVDEGNGMSKAWIVAPAGATLLGASAVVTGVVTSKTDVFNIKTTCPATASPSVSPPASSPTGPVSPATPDPTAVAVLMPGVVPGRDAAAGRGAGAGSAGEQSSEGVMNGAPSDNAPGTSADARPEPAAATTSGDGAGVGRLVLAASAVLASVGGAAVLMMIRRRITWHDRPRRVGRHHLLPGSK